MSAEFKYCAYARTIQVPKMTLYMLECVVEAII